MRLAKGVWLQFGASCMLQQNRGGGQTAWEGDARKNESEPRCVPGFYRMPCYITPLETYQPANLTRIFP